MKINSRQILTIFGAIALLCGTPSVEAQDLFDEADGGSWFASRSVSVTDGLLTSSSISLWRHPALGMAEIRVLVQTEASQDAYMPNALALKIDGELAILECEGSDIDSGLGSLADLSLMALASCSMDYEFSDILLNALTLEVQISTDENDSNLRS